MISQIRQVNKRRHIQNQNLEIDKKIGFNCEFERIVFDEGARSHPSALFINNKTKEVSTKKARNARNQSSNSLFNESSQINNSAPSSHKSDPEQIFNEQKLAELMER